jgi:hypothetical protein
LSEMNEFRSICNEKETQLFIYSFMLLLVRKKNVLLEIGLDD